MRVRPSASFLLAALLLCTARIAWAQGGGAAAADQQKEGTSPTDQQIEEKLQNLQKEIEALGTKIDQLEKSLPGQPGAAPTPPAQPPCPVRSPFEEAPPKEVVRELWQTIRKGVTDVQVEKTLGPPEITMKVDSKTVWYYYYKNIGGGSVVFRKDGKVIGWQKPPFGWWKLW